MSEIFKYIDIYIINIIKNNRYHQNHHRQVKYHLNLSER